MPDLFDLERTLGADQGPGYHKLWTAAAVSTLGDGVFLAALPLLAATLSRDPLQVSLVAFAGWLPWLLFGLVSGALVDRWDRRRVMWTVDAVRLALVGGLGVAVLAGGATIPLLATVGFLLGIGQTLFDNAAQSLIPALVTRDTQRLERANSQLYGAQTVSQNFVGPPAGGFLFALAASVPFLADAASFAVSSALIAAIRGRFAPERAAEAPRLGLWVDIAEGLRWLLGHRLLRTLAVMVGLMNLATMAGEAILVLAATLLMAVAWLVFGVGSNAWIGAAMLAIAGGTGVVFNVVGVSLRQAIVPDRLIGRVVSAFRTLAYGAVPAGAILGGAVARTLGLRAPFLLGAAVLAAAGLLALPVVNNRTIQAARVAAEAAPPINDA